MKEGKFGRKCIMPDGDPNAAPSSFQDRTKSRKWNDVFDVAAGDKVYAENFAGNNPDGTKVFNGDTEQILVGVDLSRESMVRAVATDSETGDEFSLVTDDQFVTRQSKIGYYGSIEEGRMIIDDRVLTGLIV